MILKGCQEQFDQALEEILGQVLIYFNSGLTHWKNTCENSNIAIEYSDAKSALINEQSTIQVDNYLPEEYLTGSEMSDFVEDENQILTKRYKASEDEISPTIPEVNTLFYNKQRQNAFCNYIINAHNIVESGASGFNSPQMKSVLLELLQIGIDFSKDIKKDIIDNNQLSEEQKLDLSNEILKTSISNYIMNKYYGE